MRFQSLHIKHRLGLCIAVFLFLPSDVSLAQGQGAPGGGDQRPPVSVSIAKAERKPAPVRLDAIGTVQTIATVAVRSRVDSQIMDVSFEDGATVKAGDILFKLDSRQIEAQLRQADANLARDRASLTLADADLKRAEELARRDFGTEQRLDTARTLVATLRASVRGGEAAIEGLRVQLSYYTISAPLAGRIGVAGLRSGNIARTGEAAAPLAVINQITPIYVSFSMPQRHLQDIREAMGSATVTATMQGYDKGIDGKLALIDNAVDATTGTIQIRAVFENPSNLLWPGALCSVRMTLRMEQNALVVPREAVQSGQTGSYVFIIENGVARTRPVTVARTLDNEAVLASGLQGGETVVTDGQLLLTDGTRVAPRGAGSGQPPRAPSAAPGAAPAGDQRPTGSGRPQQPGSAG
jgi:membrane fusion protein, multidrug efflux system